MIHARRSALTWLAAAALLSACSQQSTDGPAATDANTSKSQAALAINWQYGQVNEALTRAKDQDKPVLLYWGAQWCPPCMQLKSTLFKQPDFILKTRQFITVYLDGDSEGAQRWGEHFAIVGYPTLIVLRADGTELTRISSGMDLAAYPRVLDSATRQTRAAGELLAAALSDPAQLKDDDWTLLAYYGWFQDQGRALGDRALQPILEQLAAEAPKPALAQRFRFLARIAAVSLGEGALAEQDQAPTADMLRGMLTDRAQLRAAIDELNYFSVPLLLASTKAGSDSRQALAQKLDAAMQAASADPQLSIKDRLYAVRTRIELHKALHDVDAGAIPEALKADAREIVTWARQAATTPAERQAMANYARYTLESAGLDGDAEQLLLAEIERSENPYYFMPALADYAQARGEIDEALGWLERAYRESTGPATRAQWGYGYLLGLLEMAPEQVARVEAVALEIIGELREHPSAFYQRTRMRFERLDTALQAWAQEQEAAASLTKISEAMQAVCTQLPESTDTRSSCERLFAAVA